MRDIKFRAWLSDGNHKENEQMIYGDCLDKSLEETMWRKFWSNYHCWMGNIKELMQYTGLTDSKGIEIYEGDIVRYTFDNLDSVGATENGLKIRTDKIFWSDWRASFAIGCKMTNTDLFRYIRNGNRVEIIGNIYENPELLKAVI